MRGGKSIETGQSHALRQAGVALLAIYFTWVSATTTFCASAHPNHESDQCAPLVPSEQSIVISAKKLLESENPLVTDVEDLSAEAIDAEGALQPIANISEYEPDLAEPQTAALVPTLAERVGTSSDAKSSACKPPRVAEKEKPPALVTRAEAEAISFHGIVPGISKRIDVLRTWGDPRSDDTQAPMLKYRFDNLPSVEVRFESHRVESILVKLEKPTSAAALAKKLELWHLRPATKTNAAGTAVARLYPERGVEFRYALEEQNLAIASDHETPEGDGSPRISSIVIQPIQAASYLLRAETNSPSQFTRTIADLEAALKLDHTLSAARFELADIHLNTGKAVTAERYAAESVEQEPRNAGYRLQWAKSLRQLARYDRAVEEVRQVLETPNLASLTRAQALNEMGLLASLGSLKVARRAMPLHSKAIEIADGLAVGDDPQVRLPAKQLLVEAHLAVAVEISRGAWQQKDETVPQWIERASALAEALIAEEDSYLPLRLQVAVSSLAAAANLEKPINPLLWVEEAEETLVEIKMGVFDPLALGQYEWQLGLAYFHGSQIEHRRSEPDSAIHLGELADQQLAELAKSRDEMPDTAYLMGRLYFQIGAVHAVHYEDHSTACQWYDEAIDRLLNPVPVTTMAAPQEHGDALVSMGVSYWNQDERQRAIEVTELGVELIEQAVSSGLLESETLMVSYSNLSAMYEAQGEQEPAARYERLARKITRAEVSQNSSKLQRR